LVDEGLSAVAGGVLDVGFLNLADGGERVAVVAEEVAQVKGVGDGLVDGDGKARLGACGDVRVDLHFVDAHFCGLRGYVVVVVSSDKKVDFLLALVASLRRDFA
jgi:hypothetical protein